MKRSVILNYMSEIVHSCVIKDYSSAHARKWSSGCSKVLTLAFLGGVRNCNINIFLKFL